MKYLYNYTDYMYFIFCIKEIKRHLFDDLFQIRLDVLVDKWSGSIEVGITTHNPSVLDFPATMTNMRSGKSLRGL